MANYEVRPEQLTPYLPHGVELDLFEGKAYVSLVGFMFKKTSLFHIPIPFLGTFEEINLRFYVKRTTEEGVKRGVVFINETVPYQPVAWLANRLYKEHYKAVPTRNTLTTANDHLTIRYEWSIHNQWQSMEVRAEKNPEEMPSNSIEEFIFEHYYGYTKVDELRTQEYRVNHPRWRVRKVLEDSIQCDFTAMYGPDFSFLNDRRPDHVILAEGSPVSVDWKRTEF
jgi:hypothetical protein